MARRKPAEVEILPPEDDQLPKGRKRLVDAEHTIKYSAPVPVTVEEEPEEDDLFSDIDPVEVEKKHKRKTAKTERDELRKKMMSHGVTAASPLKLIIEKYAHSDGPDSGTTAEKSHCTKYGCDEAHLLNQDYMNVAARWGAGRYWFTLYKDGTIVTQWEKRLEPPRQPIGPVIQNVSPADPNSPQVIVQTNSDGQTQQIPMSIKDIMKTQREALKEQLEMAKLMREAYGFAPEPQQQPKSEEEVLASVLIKQPTVVETIVDNLIRKTGGKGGDDEPWPWYATAVKDAITTGQLAPTVRELVKGLFPNGLFGGFGNLFGGGQNNGQAEMAQTPLQTSGAVDSQWANDGRNDQPQEITQGNQTLQSANGEANQQSGMLPTAPPEEQALQLLIDHCQRAIPARIAFDRLLAYADLLNEQAPHLSIDGYISLFAQMTPDQAIEFVKTQPNGEQVAKLDHAQAWCAELQRLIKEAGQEGDGE